MTRSVEDAALLYAAMQGADPLDPRTRALPYADPMPELKRGVRGLRLARMPEPSAPSPPPRCSRPMTPRSSSSSGSEPRSSTSNCLRRLRVICRRSTCASWRPRATRSSRSDRRSRRPLDEHVRPRIAAGRTITAQGLSRDAAAARRDEAEFAAALEGIDALLTPTTTTALPLDEVDQTRAPAHYTRFGNCLTSARLRCRTASHATGYRLRSRSSAAPTTRRRRCASAGPTRTLRIGTLRVRPSRLEPTDKMLMTAREQFVALGPTLLSRGAAVGQAAARLLYRRHRRCDGQSSGQGGCASPLRSGRPSFSSPTAPWLIMVHARPRRRALIASRAQAAGSSSPTSTATAFSSSPKTAATSGCSGERDRPHFERPSIIRRMPSKGPTARSS